MMDKNTKKYLDNLIKDASLEKAPANFSKRVMQDVTILSGEVELKDEKLSFLLKKHIITEPSTAFTSNTMKEVESINEFSYEPIISKKTWYIIIIVFLAAIVYSFTSKAAIGDLPILTQATSYFKNLDFSALSLELNVSPTLVFSLFALSSLLLVDYGIRARETAKS